jgi:FkbM family methyltransferase
MASSHRPAARAVLAGSVWEEETLEYIRGTGGDGDVVHAGTYFGDFIPALSAGRRPGALVFAFEPNAENFRCADMTVRLNGLHNVVLHHAGLGSTAATARVRTTDTGGRALGGASRIVDADDSGGDEVVIRSIDSVVSPDREVAVIQLDVEGFEQRALEGALATIKRCRPLLVVESLPAAEWIADHLSPLGYRVDRRIDANTALRAER